MADPDPIETTGRARAEGGASKGAPPPTTFYIALVDDDHSLLPTVQLVAEGAFEGRCLVRQKSRGLEAIYDFMSQPPDLVVLDLKLPDVDGLTVLRLMKSDARLRDVPVMILSANSNWNMLQLALDAGADSYIYKPFSLETLAGALKDLAVLKRRGRLPVPPPFPLDEPDDGGARRLLVIEDHEDTVGLLERALAHPRVAIEVASDGHAGAKLAAARPPDVILLDVMLPRMGSFEIFVNLRRTCPETRVILMSAHAGPRVLALAKELGAFASFTKPFDATLRPTVLRALRIRESAPA